MHKKLLDTYNVCYTSFMLAERMINTALDIDPESFRGELKRKGDDFHGKKESKEKGRS
ncbi:MAG: hypothetical protein AAB386_01910 [Patescibacteria group bacterium]